MGRVPARQPKRKASRGDLQARVLSAVWGLGEATVEQVRTSLPAEGPAYNTVQTVLNRLVDRGLLSRKSDGRRFVYRARADQTDYLTRAILGRLGQATPDARRGVLMRVVNDLQPNELDELARYANRIRRERRKAGADD